MTCFKCDYSQAAHPRILKAIGDHGTEHFEGYALDEYSIQAQEIIKEMIGRPDAEVHMMIAGTPTNVISIAAALKPFECVVAPRTAHIYHHECGAVEKAGHKIIPMESIDGKITPEQVDKAWLEYEDEHTLVPRLLYISQATEHGTVYSLSELEALRACCDKHNMLLYIDGARLGVALTAPGSDATLKDIARLADAFYIGGTKNGLLMGEAVVLLHDTFKDHYRWMIKQNNGMLAKGYLIGIQFIEFLKDGDNSLFYQVANHMNSAAAKIRRVFEAKGYDFWSSSTTNQIFPILPKKLISILEKDFDFYVWAPVEGDDSVMVTRFVTGFGTTSDDVDALLKTVMEYRD